MPFGPYRDFDDCVRRNQSKRNPEAYCGKIKHQAEGGMTPGEIMVEMIEMAVANGARDGDWVRARPMGWDQIEDNPDVIVGGAPTVGPLTGLLTIVKSSVPGVSRYSVAGLTVDPNTIVVVSPPVE